MPTFYTYRSFEEFDGGRSYIGYRKCPEGKTPKTDPYLGSYTDATFTPTAKEILGVYYSKEEALQAEITLHKQFDVARNPHFTNKAIQTSTKFYIAKHSKETRRKISEAMSRENNPMYGKRGYWYGKNHSEETKAKISKANIGKKLSEENKEKLSKSKLGENNPMYGKTGENNPNYTPRNWYHPVHGEVLQKSCSDLIKIFLEQNLNDGALSQVALGKRSHHKGWRLYVNIEPSKNQNGTKGTVAEQTT